MYAGSNLGQERRVMGVTAANASRTWRALAARRLLISSRLWQHVWLIAAFLAPMAASFLVYWPRLGDYFVYDDFFWLRAVRNHSFWVVMYRAFTFPTPKEFDEVTLFWRPLTDFYFYGARTFGLHPEPYHAVNIALHGAVGGLGVLFLWRLVGSLWRALVSGLLFTVAPTYEFAVTWVSQVSELLGAALMLGALSSYLAYLKDAGRGTWPFAMTLLFAALAFLTKESTIILVALLPGLAVALPSEERRRSPAEIARGLAAVSALGAAFAAIMVIHEYRAGGAAYEMGPHMARNVRDYLEWMFVPRFGWSDAARTALMASFLTVGAACLLLRQRLLVFFFTWTIAALLPFSGFIFGIEFRYTYLASLPFIAFIVYGLSALPQLLPQPARSAVTGVLAAAAVAALFVTPFHTRNFQGYLVREAAGYEVMVESVRGLCGELPPESFVYVLRPGYRDLFGIHTPAALNLYYERVHAASVDELPELIAFVPNKCIIEYDRQTRGYRKVDVE